MEKHFVVKEHQANYTIGNLEPEDLFNFLNQSISIVKGLQSFDEEIGDYLKEISENSETNALAKPDLETVLTDDDIDELLEIIEAAEIQNFDAIVKFYNHCYSTWDSLNAYIKNTLVIIKEFNVIVTKYSSSWTCPSLIRFLLMVKILLRIYYSLFTLSLTWKVLIVRKRMKDFTLMKSMISSVSTTD